MRVAVEVLQRQPPELGFDVTPHAVDGALRDPGHDVSLGPGEQRGRDVNPDRKHEQVAELGVVDALPRRYIHAR